MGWKTEVIKDFHCVICAEKAELGLAVDNLGVLLCNKCIRDLYVNYMPFKRKFENHPKEMLEMYLKMDETRLDIKQDIGMELNWRKKDRRKKQTKK